MVSEEHAFWTNNHHGAANGAPAPSPFYIQAPSPLADEQTRVLKHADTFAVFDHHGDVKPSGLGEEGLYHDGTRHLSCFLLLLGKDRPLFLSSMVKDDNDLLTVDLTNPDLLADEHVAVPRGTLHLFRSRFLWAGTCYDRLHVRNFGLTDVEFSFSLHFRADFADIFEVRGSHRPRRGRHLAPTVEGSSVLLAYDGLDGVQRRTRIAFDPAPNAVLPTEAFFRAALAPHGDATFDIAISCESRPHNQTATAHDSIRPIRPIGPIDSRPLAYDAAHTRAADEMRQSQHQIATVRTCDPQFNDWITRGTADLAMMTTNMHTGPYPYAGVPWFSTPFGRDGLLTALECLWLNPAMTRGVLAFLADTHATEVHPAQDAEPGKILHEARGGEMAALGEVPFGRYYGSVDATPLFV
jgi:glycogen debranching enzyme